MTHNRAKIAGILAIVIVIVIIIFMPVYRALVITGCVLHGGTIRRNIATGDSKATIQNGIKAAKKLDSVVDCAGPSKTTTFKLYVL